MAPQLPFYGVTKPLRQSPYVTASLDGSRFLLPRDSGDLCKSQPMPWMGMANSSSNLTRVGARYLQVKAIEETENPARRGLMLGLQRPLTSSPRG